VKLLYSALFASALLYGQAKPEFEVASIKPSSEAPEGQFNLGVHIDGAQVRVTYFSLKDYVLMAYDMKTYQFAGPDWMATTRFDLSAKVPEGSGRPDIRSMMRTLLESRFQIKVHKASKDLPVYALVVAKSGPKLTQSKPDENAPTTPNATNVNVTAGRGSTNVDLGNGASIVFGESSLEGHKLPMATLADQLGRFVDRPVVDQTNLTGTYDFKLDFQPDDFRAMRIRAAIAAGVNLPPQALRLLEGVSDGPLLTAIQTLGLRMESRKAPVEVLVVDNALKLPTEN
jgi:uncharacterized protein (TIGR03435 family)